MPPSMPASLPPQSWSSMQDSFTSCPATFKTHFAIILCQVSSIPTGRTTRCLSRLFKCPDMSMRYADHWGLLFAINSTNSAVICCSSPLTYPTKSSQWCGLCQWAPRNSQIWNIFCGSHFLLIRWLRMKTICPRCIIYPHCGSIAYYYNNTKIIKVIAEFSKRQLS